MTRDILSDAREFIGDRHERLQTHSEGCWRWHPACMVGLLAREVERLRTIMYRIVDEDCTVAIQGGTFYADGEPLFAVPCTPPTQPTPGEGSTPREGTSEPVAWWLKGSEYDTGCEYEYVSLLKENAEAAAAEGGTVTPLYTHPKPVVAENATATLTDAEREAVRFAAAAALPETEKLGGVTGELCRMHAATLRGLLERLGTAHGIADTATACGPGDAKRLGAANSGDDRRSVGGG